MKFGVIEQLSVEVIKQAKLWCENNREWVSISDIKNINNLYETFDEISRDKQLFWEKIFGKKEAVKAYEEYSVKKCKYDYGFINIKGEFYNDLLDVPFGEEVATVYKIKK